MFLSELERLCIMETDQIFENSILSKDWHVFTTEIFVWIVYHRSMTLISQMMAHCCYQVRDSCFCTLQIWFNTDPHSYSAKKLQET